MAANGDGGHASTLLAGAVLAALVAGHGHILAGNAWFAAIDVSSVLLVMHARSRRMRRLQASAMDGCVEALKGCSLGALLALATAAILVLDAGLIGPELWLLTAVAVSPPAWPCNSHCVVPGAAGR